MNSEKLALKSYISFGLAGASSTILFTMIGSYQSLFYADVLGITAGAIAIIMLVSKIWDAINDPMMGIIAERTKTKWGRFRPWLLWMSPVLGISFVLTFTNWPGSPAMKAVLAGVGYILFGMAYTAAGIPMQSLPKDMYTVETHKEDVPFDMEAYVDSDGNTYDFGFGLNFNGVISDERTKKWTKDNWIMR